VEPCKQYRSTVEFNFVDSTALINAGDPCKRALRYNYMFRLLAITIFRLYMNPKKVVVPLGSNVNTPYLHYYLRCNYMFRLLAIAIFRLYMNPKKVVVP